jgi:hypothetical protein
MTPRRVYPAGEESVTGFKQNFGGTEKARCKFNLSPFLCHPS